VELRAPVEHRYPLRHVPYAEVTADPGLHFKAGGPASSRTLNMLLAKNVEAGRLTVGVTWSEPGNWTSWPPHEHADLAEELYVYYGMPPEAFGIQLVYTDKLEPERIEMVRDGDVVIMPKGFHPNVAIPGHPICFLHSSSGSTGSARSSRARLRGWDGPSPSRWRKRARMSRCTNGRSLPRRQPRPSRRAAGERRPLSAI
jgi:5-deoxy-D-glucuronate isomerase